MGSSQLFQYGFHPSSISGLNDLPYDPELEMFDIHMLGAEHKICVQNQYHAYAQLHVVNLHIL